MTLSDFVSAMLPSQRELFSIDDDICYLDSAAVTPMPDVSVRAAVAATAGKARPWERDPGVSHALAEEVRAAAAAVIGAAAADVAVINAVSYGLATVANNIGLARGHRVLLVEGEHSSQCLTWRFHADKAGADLEFVPTPVDGDWTAAILEAIARPGAAPLAVVSVGPNMWSDGTLIDLLRIGDAARAQGAALVVDATQGAGVMDIDVAALQPDFLVFPAYKWLLGPYSLAFLYVAPRWQDGVPLEQTGQNRKLDRRMPPSFLVPGFVDGARRFDMGERDSFMSLPTALASLRLVLGWPRADVEARARMLTDRLATALAATPLSIAPRSLRSPHILGAKGNVGDIVQFCRDRNVIISERNGSLRISVHVFNTEADVGRCAEVIREFFRS
jgi:selenocysteine lyase/cysteine desulfurase